jgi:hypothetical protein
MNRRSVIDAPQIRAELAKAWQDSMPGLIGGVEIGGFIVEDGQGQLLVVRWPPGTQDQIHISPHPGCKIGGLNIIATFHTHPNTDRIYRQEPSREDIFSIRNDRNLKEAYYEGEYVISEEKVYHISPHGVVSVVGDTPAVFRGEVVWP